MRAVARVPVLPPVPGRPASACRPKGWLAARGPQVPQAPLYQRKPSAIRLPGRRPFPKPRARRRTVRRRRDRPWIQDRAQTRRKI
ncbi:MAG TPA: hypothetical protein DCG48_06280 [Rhodospirillaceae bacterium]|nr:hypothetical protein [Rhodospirillaceae bacterium]